MSSLEIALPTRGSSALDMHSLLTPLALRRWAAPRRFWVCRFASKPIRWQFLTAFFSWLHAALRASWWFRSCPKCQPSISRSPLRQWMPNEKHATWKETDYDVSPCTTARTSSGSQTVLALGAPGFDIHYAFGGTTILCDSNALNPRAGDRSCTEAKSFGSPPQSFCRPDAKQERRSEIQLSASNRDEW